MDYSLFISINSEDYIRLFTADSLIHDYNDYVINWNSPWLNYCKYIAINDKNDNCPIPTTDMAFFVDTDIREQENSDIRYISWM